MNGYGEVQLFDVSWDFNKNLGYLALENGNGRITLMSIPYMSNFNVCINDIMLIQGTYIVLRLGTEN